MAHSAPHHPQNQVSVVALLLIHCRPLIPSPVGHGCWSSLVMSGRLLVVSSVMECLRLGLELALPGRPLPCPRFRPAVPPGGCQERRRRPVGMRCAGAAEPLRGPRALALLTGEDGAPP
jgi:hypothetical protein